MSTNRPRQLHAAVCGNRHILDDSLDHPPEPGSGGIPRLCPTCSAPVFTRCTNEGCDAPINGDKDYAVVVVGAPRRADWFCQSCGKPYLWAKPDQLRSWIENPLKFDSDLDPESQIELIEELALLVPPEDEAPQGDLRRFTDLLKRAPALYQELKPFIPILTDVIR